MACERRRFPSAGAAGLLRRYSDELLARPDCSRTGVFRVSRATMKSCCGTALGRVAEFPGVVAGGASDQAAESEES